MKNVKRGLSLLLAALLIAAVLPVSAATVDTVKYETLYVDKTLTISETLKLEKDDTIPPTVVYSFEVTSTEPTTVQGEALKGAQGNPAFIKAAVQFNKDDIYLPVGNGDYSRQATKTVVLDFSGVTFTEPGIYRWTITKTMTDNTPADATSGRPSNNKQITYVYVTVTDDTGADGKLKLKDVGYIYTTASEIPSNNYFDLDGDKASPRVGMIKIDSIEDQYPARTRNLTFGKKVTGNQGSKDKYFKFTLNISGLKPGASYTVSGQDKTISLTDATTYSADAIATANNRDTLVADVKGAINQTFYLQHGDYVTVTGLPVGASYSVTEASEEYKQTAGTDDEVQNVLSLDTDSIKDRLDEIGDASSGLIKAKQDEIDAAQAQIKKLNGDASTTGSIAEKTKEITDKQTEIDAITTSTEEAAVAAQQTVITNKTTEIEKLDQEIDTVEAAIAAKKTEIENKIKEVHGSADGQGYKAYKDALEAYETALTELNTAQQAVITAQQNVYNATSDLAKAKNALDEANANLTEATNAVTTATAVYNAAETELTDATAALTAATTAKTNADTALTAAQNTLTTAQSELAAAQAEDPVDADKVADKQAAVDAAQAAVDTAKANVDAADAALTAATARQTAAQASFDAAETAKNKAEAAETAAQTAVTTAQGDKATKETAKTNADTALSTAQGALTAKQTALSTAKTALEAAQTALSNGDTAIQTLLDALAKLYDDGTDTTTDSLQDKNTLKLAAQKAFAEAQGLKYEAEEALAAKQNAKAKAERELEKLKAEEQLRKDELIPLQDWIDKLVADMTALTNEKKNLEDEKTALENGKTFSDPTQGVIKQASVYTGYTNEKETIVPTGILLQVGASIAGILAALVLFMILFISKRKKRNAA